LSEKDETQVRKTYSFVQQFDVVFTATTCSVTSAHMEQLGSHWTDFHEI